MKANLAISTVVAVISGVLLMLVDSAWLVSEWTTNPSRMGSYTILMLVLGACVYSLLSNAAAFFKKRGEKREQLRKQEERRAAAERKRAEQEAQAAAKADRVREHVESLDEEQIALLATAYKYGIIERDYDTRDAVILRGMAKLGLVSGGTGAVTCAWQLTDTCRRVMEEMEGGTF